MFDAWCAQASWATLVALYWVGPAVHLFAQTGAGEKQACDAIMTWFCPRVGREHSIRMGSARGVQDWAERRAWGANFRRNTVCLRTSGEMQFTSWVIWGRSEN